MKYDEEQRLKVRNREVSKSNYRAFGVTTNITKEQLGPSFSTYQRHPLSGAVFVSETFMIVESKMNFEDFT